MNPLLLASNRSMLIDPISDLEIDKGGKSHWLTQGACVAREVE